MTDTIITIWFFIALIPSTYLIYLCLQCFDYEKLLRKNQTKQLKILLFIISVGFGFLFSQCFVTILERISKIINI